jgi:RNA polymerase sigma-70 factor (ECF subfamily)
MITTQELPWRAISDALALPACAAKPVDTIIAATGGAEMKDQPGDITILLKRWKDGDPDAEAPLFEAVFPHLRRLARYLMSRDRAGHTLQPSALLNEAYCRVVKAKDQDWQNRRHFFAVCAMMMRRCLVDYARARPPVQFVSLEEVNGRRPEGRSAIEDAVAVDLVLDELRTAQPEMATIIDMKVFLGFTDEETCEALDLPLRSMQRLYQKAREWLFRRLYAQHAPA